MLVRKLATVSLRGHIAVLSGVSLGFSSKCLFMLLTKSFQDSLQNVSHNFFHEFLLEVTLENTLEIRKSSYNLLHECLLKFLQRI